MTNPEQLAQHLRVPDPDLYERVSMRLGPLLKRRGLYHEGLEVISQIDGPVIIASKHNSNTDTPALAEAVLEASDTQLHFMAKKELWEINLLRGPIKKMGRFGKLVDQTGWLNMLDIDWFGKKIEQLGSFPVDRDAKILTAETREHLERRVEGKAAIVVYPEMTRRKGHTIDAKHVHGVHMFAALFGIPVLPVGISGTEKVYRGPIQIVGGELINAPPPVRKWAPVARALQSEIVVGMQNAQDRAIALRAQLL